MDSEVPSVVVVPSGTPRPIEEVVTQILASLDLSSIDSTPFVNKLKVLAFLSNVLDFILFYKTVCGLTPFMVFHPFS